MVWRVMALAGITYFAAGQVLAAVPAPVTERITAWHTRVQISAAYRIALLTSQTEPATCTLG